MSSDRERLAEYRQRKAGRPREEAERWAAALTDQEALDLVGLIDLIEQREADMEEDRRARGGQTDGVRLQDERDELGGLGGVFRRRLAQISLRMARESQQNTGATDGQGPENDGAAEAA